MNTHHCRGLGLCGDHPRWHVLYVPAPGAYPWAVYPPRSYIHDDSFPTLAEAVAYATAQARRASSLPSRRLTPTTDTPKETP